MNSDKPNTLPLKWIVFAGLLPVILLVAASVGGANYSSDPNVVSSGGRWSTFKTWGTVNMQWTTFTAGHGTTIGQSSAIGYSWTSTASTRLGNYGGFWGAAVRTQQCVPWPQDMAAWWKAHDNASDAFGNFNGSWTTNTSCTVPSYTAGKVGKAFSFNGTNQCVSIDQAVSPLTNNFAVEAWVNWSGDTTDQVIYAAGKPMSYAVLIQPDDATPQSKGRLLIYVSGGVTPLLKTRASVITRNEWQHIVVTRSAGRWYAYVDGKPEAFIQGDDTAEPVTPANSTYIGGTGVSGTYFNGAIDELVFYSGAVTETQAAVLSGSGRLGHCDPSTAQGKFSFNPVTGAAANQWIESNEITVPALPYSVPVIIDGCDTAACGYSINGGDWTSDPGTVNKGDTIKVQQLSAGDYGVATRLTLDIGGMTSSFLVQTDNTMRMLTVSIAGEGSGSVISSPSGINCGTDCSELFGNIGVALTAIYDTNLYAVEWTGDCVGNAGSCSVTMNDNRGVTAKFSPQPETRFVGNPTNGSAPLLVQFTDTSVNSPASWSWNFGDSLDNTATVQNPSHLYRNPGQYTVTMSTSAGVRTLTNYITVDVCNNDPVKTQVGSYYPTVNEGYTAAVSGHSLLAQAIAITGDVLIDTTRNITLKGGYDCGFNSAIDMTYIQGNVQITGGNLTIEGIIIK